LNEAPEVDITVRVLEMRRRPLTSTGGSQQGARSTPPPR
jgi:hypothetical protein